MPFPPVNHHRPHHGRVQGRFLSYDDYPPSPSTSSTSSMSSSSSTTTSSRSIPASSKRRPCFAYPQSLEEVPPPPTSAASAVAARRKRSETAGSAERSGARAWYSDNMQDIVLRKQAAYAQPPSLRSSRAKSRPFRSTTSRSREVSWTPSSAKVLGAAAKSNDSSSPTSQPVPSPSPQGIVPRPLGGGELSDPDTVVELCPGVYARLRGAAETYNCIETDGYIPVLCVACTQEILCIEDASYVLCPHCKIVSPLPREREDPFHTTAMPSSVVDGGVGLGFTYNNLFEWQSQILKKRDLELQQKRSQRRLEEV